MRKICSYLLFIVLATLMILPACNKKKSSVTSGPERPFQPWVFRSVLDSQSRIVTLALHDDMWVAYRTDSCSLYKAWKGHVHLQGAVYDNAHGPQPMSIGDAWLVNTHLQPWSVKKGDQEMLSEVQYAGHSFMNGHVSLMYTLICNDGTNIKVYEQPEAIEKANGQLGFERIFKIENAPADYEVSIAQQVTSIALA